MYRQTDGETQIDIDTHMDGQTNGYTDSQMDGWMDRQINRWTARQIDRQTNKEIDGQTDQYYFTYKDQTVKHDQSMHLIICFTLIIITLTY